MLPIWTVYDHPADYPDDYIARLFLVGMLGAVATGEIIVCKHLTALREVLAEKGLTPLNRNKDDDPKIVEVWL